MADHLGIDARHAAFVGGLFAGLAHGGVHLLPDLAHDLLDPGGMNPAVGDQALQNLPGNLAAHRIEGGNHHGFRSVVHQQVHACGGFEGADITAFPSDDPAFHVVAGQGNGAGHQLRGMAERIALDGGGDNAPGLALGGLPGLLLAPADQHPGLAADFIFQARHQGAPGFLRRHAGNPLQFLLFLLDQRIARLALLLQFLFLLFRFRDFLLDHLVFLVNHRDLAVEIDFALIHPLFQRHHFLPPALDFLFQRLACLERFAFSL